MNLYKCQSQEEQWGTLDAEWNAARSDSKMGTNVSRQLIVNVKQDRGLQISPIIGRDSLKIFDASPTGQVFPRGSGVIQPSGGY